MIDADLVADRRLAAQRDVRAEDDVAAERADVRVDVRAARIDHRHAGAHPVLVDPLARRGFDLREIDAIVDPGRLRERHVERDGAAARVRVRDEIGQVELALRVVGAQRGEVLAQVAEPDRIEPGVGVADRALLGRGIGVLDDLREHAAIVADEPAVGHLAIRHGRQQREPALRRGARVDQRRDSLGQEQRCVASEDHDDPIVGLVDDCRQRALHGVPGAALFGLQRRDHVVAERAFERRPHDLVLVTEDRHDLAGAGGLGGLDDPVHHRSAGDAMQHLRHVAPHPGAEPGCHDEGYRSLTTTHVVEPYTNFP